MKRMIENKSVFDTLAQAKEWAAQIVDEIAVIPGVIESRMSIAREDGRIVVRSAYVVEEE